MKDISGKMFTTAVAVAAGSALGILLVKSTHHSGKKYSGDSSCKNRKRERLLFVKNKLEQHRERLDGHLRRINARIEAVAGIKTAEDMNKEEVLFKTDPSLI